MRDAARANQEAPVMEERSGEGTKRGGENILQNTDNTTTGVVTVCVCVDRKSVV